MSNLAQNQYDFQVYNQKMNGPTSPVPIETLKTNAETEKIKEAALGRVFNIDTQSYEATDDASRMNLSTTEEIAKVIEEPQTLGKRKQEEIIQFTKSTYEVYTTSPVADAWGNKTTRVVYMGRENYDSAKEARDVADLLRMKGMETFVFRCNRTAVKNRKRVKGPPRKKKPAVPKPKLKSLNDLKCEPFAFGDWQCLPGGMEAKGKQQTWWVPIGLDMSGQPTNEQIRNAAVCMKQVRASEVVQWVIENSDRLADSAYVGSFIQSLPFHIKPHPETGGEDKAKIRQMTLRIRRCLPGYVPKNRVKPSDTTPAVPVSDAVLPASASQTVHPLPTGQVYTN